MLTFEESGMKFSIQEALQKRLHALLKIWKAEVLVLNEEQARIFHLCQS